MFNMNDAHDQSSDAAVDKFQGVQFEMIAHLILGTNPQSTVLTIASRK